MSDSLWPHWLQHARIPCPSSTPGACSNSCPSSWWCHPTISSSVIPFFSCPQSFPASGSFQMSQFFTSGDPSIGASSSASVLPMNIHDWFPLRFTDFYDGGGIGWGDHFLPQEIHQKIIWILRQVHKTTSERWHRTPGTRKAAHCLQKEVGQNIKRETKELGMETCPGREFWRRRSFQTPEDPLTVGYVGSFGISEGNITGRKNK